MRTSTGCRYLGHGWVIASHSILCYVITYQCNRRFWYQSPHMCSCIADTIHNTICKDLLGLCYAREAIQWNRNVVIWMKFLSLAATEVAIVTTSGLADDKNFIQMKRFPPGFHFSVMTVSFWADGTCYQSNNSGQILSDYIAMKLLWLVVNCLITYLLDKENIFQLSVLKHGVLLPQYLLKK